jgi:large subunit ribosomal protein L29
MKYSELNQKTISELYDLYGNLKKEQLNLRLQRAAQGLQKTARIRQIRRDVARIETKLTALKKA